MPLWLFSHQQWGDISQPHSDTLYCDGKSRMCLIYSTNCWPLSRAESTSVWQPSNAMFQQDQFRPLPDLWTHQENISGKKKKNLNKSQELWSNSSGAKRAYFTISQLILDPFLHDLQALLSCFSNFSLKTVFCFGWFFSKIAGRPCYSSALTLWSRGCR